MARKKEVPVDVSSPKAEPVETKTAKRIVVETDVVDPSDTDYAHKCKILGENIRFERKSRGFSIEDLAEYLDLSTSYVGLLERGARCPSIRKFFDICALFGKTPNDLLLDRSTDKDGKVSLAEPKRAYQKNNHEATIASLAQKLRPEQAEFTIELIKLLKKLDKSKE